MLVPGEGLPERVEIYEVGPRDGLQNEANTVPVAVKAEFLERLANAGLRTIEASSFVHPKWVPQLADSEELVERMTWHDGVDYPFLVPNARGLDRAIEAGVTHAAVFASATETFAQRNLNRTLDSQFEMFDEVVTRATANGMRVRAYVSMAFGEPWEGAVDAGQAASVGKRLMDMGCDQLSLGDTIGVATPGHVAALLDACVAAGVPMSSIAVHFHDTYGQALSNTLAALRHGVTTVDASAGGLGGCPFAGTSTGNLATEDLVWMLDGLGITHGVDLDALVATSVWMAGELGRPSPSRVVTALAPTD
jgi:hydroxymethylglutaryl-CoA lyase